MRRSYAETNSDTRWRLEEFGETPSDGDYTNLFSLALAHLATLSYGGTLELDAKVYTVAGGISESIHGLRVVGSGHPDFGTNTVGTSGTWIKATDTSAWVWKHLDDVSAFNVYDGVAFEGIGFMGDADTAGGLWIQTNGNIVSGCVAYGNTTGVGFKFAHSDSGLGPNDASWNKVIACMGQDNLTSYEFSGTNAGSNVIGCDSLNTTARGIVGTGKGFHVSVGNVRLTACKAEGHADGFLIDAPVGVTAGQCWAENNTRGFYLNRASGPAYASRIALTGCGGANNTTSALHVGPNQSADRITAFSTTDGTRVNDGANTLWVASDNPSSGSGTLNTTTPAMP